MKPSDFADCLTLDRPRLRGIARELARPGGGVNDKRPRLQAQLDELQGRSRATFAERRAALAATLARTEFAEELPVNARRDEIAALVHKHQVVIVCGETGSGKTTQLPKICLALGRGIGGLIGHTQPRRLAARSVAARLAQELNTSVGQGVGVKIRFHDRTSPASWVKLMTDGILLAETQTDPYLNAYDTIIIDEAHERSLNIDFLLGYLRQLLPKRPDLKVIITSATIDAERFANHFAQAGKPAPVIEVSGRLYPVEVRYRPVAPEPAAATRPGDARGGARDGARDGARPGGRESRESRESERDLYDAIVDGVDEVARLGPGDVLVFLPGEREIREAAEALRKHHPPATEILPLFSRLSAADQDRIFKPHGARRIVLATNVAETSLTVPGIRYVVDTGLARVKRYSYRNKVEQLQIERVAQAAARQRAGRCGRVAAGVCIRLYDEADFNARAPFTDPEILRASLAGVILRMKALKLGAVEDFPFIEPPPPKAIADGYALLQELGALDEDNALTPVGHGLAKLPLDPRIARMIVAARDYGCLREGLIIAAALSVQDPRERPLEKQQAADEKHKRFADEKSEFLSWLKLWDWFAHEVEHKKSNRKLDDACRDNFLSPLRLREWRDTHSQLHAMVTEQGWKENQLPATYEALHKALLTGLLGNIGCKSEEGGQLQGHYLGARGIKFLVHPSSPLQKKAGKWLMAAEITETTKLYARCVAKIEPEWLEEVGGHLIKRSYFDPHWEQKPMQAVAFERSTLYGVVINPKKRVNYGPMNPAEARELFLRQGLVGGEVSEEYARQWAFYRHNRKLIGDIENLEHKQRRQDVLVDDALIYAFYDQVVPQATAELPLYSGAAFDAWRKKAEAEKPKLLHLDRDDLMRHEAAGVTTEAFPAKIKLAGIEYGLSYHFEPGSPRDGVTLTLPLANLNQLPAPRCEWLVPGLLKEKVIQLVKTLPQKIRAKLVPVPEFAAEFAEAVGGDETRQGRGLIPALIDFVFESRGLNARGWAVTPDAFRVDALPPHLFMNYKLVDEHGRQLDMQRNLTQLRAEWGREAKQEFSGLTATPAAYTGLTDWSFGELPELMEVPVGGQTVVGYPALKDDGETVSLTVFDAPEDAAAAHRAGLTRLFLLHFREQVKYFEKSIPNLNAMAMQFMGLGSADDLKRQLIDVTFARACLAEPLPADEAAFRARCAEAKPRLGLLLQEVARLVGAVLTDWQALQKKLPALAKAYPAAVQDIEKQVARLIHKRFVVDTPFERLQHFPRYLKAAALRLDKLRANPARDTQAMSEFAALWTAYERRATQLARAGQVDPELEQFRWLLEELRVNLYAQELKTPVPVSVKRLQKMWEGLAHG